MSKSFQARVGRSLLCWARGLAFLGLAATCGLASLIALGDLPSLQLRPPESHMWLDSDSRVQPGPTSPN